MRDYYNYWLDKEVERLEQERELEELKQTEGNNIFSKTDFQASNIDKILQDLNTLIGMQTLKDEISSLINFLKIQKLRQEQRMSRIPVTLHLVFCGSPGTGKTTIEHF